MVNSTIRDSWWILLLQGLAAAIFGLTALIWTAITLFSLIMLFASFALIVGVFRVIGSLKDRQESGWWLVLIAGIASIVAGIIAFAWPGLTALALLFVVGVQALIVGVSELWRIARNWHAAEGRWLGLLSGASSSVFGVLAFVWPGATALTLVWLIGIYALVFGISAIVSSFLIRRAGS